MEKLVKTTTDDRRNNIQKLRERRGQQRRRVRKYNGQAAHTGHLLLHKGRKTSVAAVCFLVAKCPFVKKTSESSLSEKLFVFGL
jgi:hypothetical protein